MPASQGRHLALPASDNLPTSQFTHSEVPVAFAKVLTTHSVQLPLKVAPWCGLFFPAAHSLQSFRLIKPVADEYRPGGHPRQTLLETAPISVEYNPAGHSVVFLNRTNMERGEAKEIE